MRFSSKSQRPTPSTASEVDSTDDAGSGLYAACTARFTAPDYEVACDARHTVWVKRTDGARSVGLAPWLLRQHSLDEVMGDVEAKLELPVPNR